jgi:hypothetical protein
MLRGAGLSQWLRGEYNGVDASSFECFVHPIPLSTNQATYKWTTYKTLTPSTLTTILQSCLAIAANQQDI